jgi:hypothetical protein
MKTDLSASDRVMTNDNRWEEGISIVKLLPHFDAMRSDLVDGLS